MKFSPLVSPKARKADIEHAGVPASPKSEALPPGQVPTFRGISAGGGMKRRLASVMAVLCDVFDFRRRRSAGGGPCCARAAEAHGRVSVPCVCQG